MVSNTAPPIEQTWFRVLAQKPNSVPLSYTVPKVVELAFKIRR